MKNLTLNEVEQYVEENIGSFHENIATVVARGP